MASEEKLHVERYNRKRKHTSLSGGLIAKSSPSSSSTVNSQAPRGINVVEFAQARALELHNMVEGMHMADRTGKKRLFQSLPKHMRRRAMSYNVKRMPVRLREQAKKEMESKLDSKTKSTKKSRRQRRKTKVLLEDYNRRKKQNVWLETHIWHAKRMKMVNAWGYRLAEHPSDKGFRAAHRSVAKNCLLQDISYYGCIEIKGDKAHILQAMSLLTKTELGPTVGSLDCMNTGKEGHVMLYHPDQYPFGAIGPVSFLWRQHCSDGSHKQKDHDVQSNLPPVHGNENGYQMSQLWIWVHPACFREVFEAIKEACERVTVTVVVYDDCHSPVNTGTQHQLTLEKNNNTKGTRQNKVTVSSLRFDLVRFRLTGPLSHSLLVSMLELPGEHNPSHKEGECSMDTESSPLKENEELVFELKDTRTNGVAAIHTKNNSMQGTSNESEKLNHLRSEDVWEILKSTNSSSLLPPYSVIALTVIDPRLGMPGIRTSIDAVVPEQQRKGGNFPLSSSSDTDDSTECSSKLFYTNWPSHIAASSIWDSETRQQAKETKVEEQKLNQMRSKLLIPGSRLDIGDKTSHVPVLLVQQPGSNGYGGGWDIILPSGWAMAFWMALVYRGARVGGLRESRNCSLEREETYFPRDIPDTRSGIDHDKEMKTEEETKYYRYPPAKRPNYQKLGISSPFSIPWSQLVEDWSFEAQTFETLDRQEIDNETALDRQEIDNETALDRQEIDNETALDRQEIDIQTALDRQEIDNKTLGECREINADKVQDSNMSFDDANRAFFVLRDSSQLSCLHKTFVILQSRTKRTQASREKTYIQPAIDIMKQHPRALVGVSLRMLNKGCPLPNATVSIPTTADLEAFQKCKTFGGPSEPLHKGSKQSISMYVADGKTIIGCCTRKVIGFVTSGQYSLSRGFGVGIAYCALPGIIELLTLSKQAVVLVRNATTQQYRLALLRKKPHRNLRKKYAAALEAKKTKDKELLYLSDVELFSLAAALED